MWLQKKKPKTEYITLILNRFQVQVYNNNDELIYTTIAEGFTPLAAIDAARRTLQDSQFPIEKLIYPLRFFTVVK